MKTFLKICKWLGITAIVGIACCTFYSCGVAKGKGMTIPEYWQSKSFSQVRLQIYEYHKQYV